MLAKIYEQPVNHMSPKNWQAVIGDFSFDKDALKYHGAIIKSEKPEKEDMVKIGVAMSDEAFSGGSLSMNVQYGPSVVVPSAYFVLYRNPVNESMITVGMDGGILKFPNFSRFAIYAHDNSRPPESSQQSPLVAKTPYVERSLEGELTLKVTQVGSLIDLYANGVLMLRHTFVGPLPRSQCGVYLQSGNDVTIREFSVDSRRRRAFVLMQFSPPFYDLFNDVIRPVSDSVHVTAEKADDTVGPGLILTDIIKRLIESDIIIADITPENQNVFYELGYAHAMGKPTILLAEKGKKLPFDVSGHRVLFYENSIAGKAHLESGLRRHLAAILSDQSVPTAV